MLPKNTPLGEFPFITDIQWLELVLSTLDFVGISIVHQTLSKISRSFVDKVCDFCGFLATLTKFSLKFLSETIPDSGNTHKTYTELTEGIEVIERRPPGQ